MMRALQAFSLAVLLGVAPARPVPPPAPPAPAAYDTPSALAADREIWMMVIGFVTAAAEQVPAAKYSYRPAPTVRTFGGLIAHIAGTQEMFCAQALGEEFAPWDKLEKTMTEKEDLVPALKASTEHCKKAYAMSDEDANKRTVKMFAGDRSALWDLLYNTVHVDEHYGNIVTYMRTLGLVPPSSQPMR
jgi:uncharacterized damage-inducible protein DinB